MQTRFALSSSPPAATHVARDAVEPHVELGVTAEPVAAAPGFQQCLLHHVVACIGGNGAFQPLSEGGVSVRSEGVDRHQSLKLYGDLFAIVSAFYSH